MRAGESIGGYEIRERIAGGGQAEVFRVWNSGLERLEAMKIPHAHLTHDPSYVARFRRGARIAANLQHPHIVPIYNVSAESISDGSAETISSAPPLFFTMELLEGGDLSDQLARGLLPPQRALEILRDIASALDFAHARQVVHRDIKPANIMLQKRATAGDDDAPFFVKVVDFEIARALSEGATRLTETGMIVGSLPYLSPEQAGSGEPVSARSDQYSLGILAYEMLCGQPPFTVPEGSNAVSVLMKHLYTPPPAPTLFNAALPSAVEAVLLRALAKTAGERFDSCGEFVAHLERAFQTPEYSSEYSSRTEQPRPKEETQEETRDEKIAPPPHPRPRPINPRNRIAIAVVASACAGIALIVWVFHVSHLSPALTPAPRAPSTPAAAPLSRSEKVRRAAQEADTAHSYNLTVSADNVVLREETLRFLKVRSTLSKTQRDSQFAALSAEHSHVVSLAQFAVAHARAGLKLDPANVQALYELCYGLYCADDEEEAQRTRKHLYALFPHFAQEFPRLEAALHGAETTANIGY